MLFLIIKIILMLILSFCKWVNRHLSNPSVTTILLVIMVLIIVAIPFREALICFLLIGYVLTHFKQYKILFRFYFWFIFAWFIFFDLAMLDYASSIVIGPDFIGYGPRSDKTLDLFFYAHLKYMDPSMDPSLFQMIVGDICITTFLVLSNLSFIIGLPIYVPSFAELLLWVIMIIVYIVIYIFGF